jgi:rubrerythrin
MKRYQLLHRYRVEDEAGRMDGPLMMRWRCEACGHIWETVTAILPRALGCPECGGRCGLWRRGRRSELD